MHVPVWDKQVLASEIAGMHSQEPSDAMKQQIDAMAQLHLARGDEKKNLMKKAGLKSVPGKVPEMATAMQKAGQLAPGQKWWANTSEGLERRLALVFSS